MALVNNPIDIIVDKDISINSETKFKNQLLWDFNNDLKGSKFPLTIPSDVKYITVNATYCDRDPYTNEYKSFYADGSYYGAFVQRISVEDIKNPLEIGYVFSRGLYWGEISDIERYLKIMNTFCDYFAGYSEPTSGFYKDGKGIIIACSTLGRGAPYNTVTYRIYSDKGTGTPYADDDVRQTYFALTGVEIPRE